jgi:streptogramin lyase
VATDGAKHIYAIGWTAISVYDLTGALQATYTPQGGLTAFVQTIAPDGALWFGIGPDAFYTNALLGRIAPDGSMSEFAVPASGTIPALAATGDGSVWFPGSSSAKMYRINLSKP